MRQSELLDTLQLPEFSRRLVQVTNYTARENLEAAFAVYNGPIVSEDVRQTQADMAKTERDHDYEGLARQSFGQIENYHMERLTHISKDPSVQPTRRTDFCILVHTHPVFGDDSPKDLLRPSEGDLTRFEKWAIHNPNHIDGIAIKHQQLGGIALLLYRAADEGFDPQRLQLIDDTLYGPHALRLVREAGVQSTVLTFDKKKGHLLSDPAALDLLY